MGNNSPLKHGGDKPILFDYSVFKKKTIRDSMSEVELSAYEQELVRKEHILKKYKYSQDFDRISTQNNQQIPTLTQAMQNYIKINAFLGIFLTRLYINYAYHSQSDFCLFKRYYVPITMTSLLFSSIFMYFSQTNHVMHDNYFAETQQNQKLYQSLDQNMNLYHYVNDIKNNWNYAPSNILQTRKIYHDKNLRLIEQQLEKQKQKINSQNH